MSIWGYQWYDLPFIMFICSEAPAALKASSSWALLLTSSSSCSCNRLRALLSLRRRFCTSAGKKKIVITSATREMEEFFFSIRYKLGAPTDLSPSSKVPSKIIYLDIGQLKKYKQSLTKGSQGGTFNKYFQCDSILEWSKTTSSKAVAFAQVSERWLIKPA